MELLVLIGSSLPSKQTQQVCLGNELSRSTRSSKRHIQVPVSFLLKKIRNITDKICSKGQYIKLGG
ncbi:hypothetical protein HanIR_Chr12g0590011 [Helianthus annuus]|nr:hypothetical protein HanIR_Chr12g0590011 [Helianthus annuus]